MPGVLSEEFSLVLKDANTKEQLSDLFVVISYEGYETNKFAGMGSFSTKLNLSEFYDFEPEGISEIPENQAENNDQNKTIDNSTISVEVAAEEPEGLVSYMISWFKGLFNH